MTSDTQFPFEASTCVRTKWAQPLPPSWRGMRYQFSQSRSIFQVVCQEQPLQSESWGDKLYSPLLVTAPNHSRRSWGPFSVCSLWTPLTTWPALQLVWITWQLGHPILSPRSLSYGFYKISTITNHRNTWNLLVKDPGVSMSLHTSFKFSVEFTIFSFFDCFYWAI